MVSLMPRTDMDAATIVERYVTMKQMLDQVLVQGWIMADAQPPRLTLLYVLAVTGLV